MSLVIFSAVKKLKIGKLLLDSSKRPTFLTASNSLHIDVTPKSALLDHPPKINVKGLNVGQKVTLWNTYIDDAGLEFSCHAHYVANENGEVDVSTHCSYGGKYKGVFAEGLISSLQAAPVTYKEKQHLKWARLFKQDVTQPMKYHLRVVDGHETEEQLYSNNKPEAIGSSEFQRHLMANGVQRKEIEYENIRGVLFKPDGQGPFPAVLDLFGAESGIKEYRSAMLASYGYASLVLPYYSYKDIPVLKYRLNFEYFLNAVDFLTNLNETTNSGIGLVGSSKGGEIGIALCSLTDKIKACASINAYNRSIDVDYYHNDKVFVEKYTPTPENANVYVNREGMFVAFGKDSFYDPDSNQTLPIEKINSDCQVLIAAGDDDGGHGHRSAITLKERSRRFKKKNASVVIYPGAGHLIDPPFHSHMKAIWNSTILIRDEKGERTKKMPHFYGGDPYDTCQASKDLWRKVLHLFHTKLVKDAQLPSHTTKLYPPY